MEKPVPICGTKEIYTWPGLGYICEHKLNVKGVSNQEKSETLAQWLEKRIFYLAFVTYLKLPSNWPPITVI